MIILKRKKICLIINVKNADKNLKILFFKFFFNVRIFKLKVHACTEISIEFRILFYNNHSKLQFHVNCFT